MQYSEESEAKKQRSGSLGTEWVSYENNIDVHEGLFNLGLLAARQNIFKGDVTSQRFPLGSRELVVRDASVLSAQHKKLIALLQRKSPKIYCDDTESDRSSSSKDGSFSTSPDSLSSSPAEISPRKCRANDVTIPKTAKLVLANPARKDEVFSPVVLREQNEGGYKIDVGMYLYPWLSSNTAAEVKQLKSLEIKQYVSAGCLFGPNIVGCHENSSSIGLIKHDIKLNAKIESIEYDAKNNPYTQALFEQFKCFCKLMNSHRQGKQPVKLLYHLPTWDYILFGVELYTRGCMTQEALLQFSDAIFAEATAQKQRLTRIAGKYNIELSISSPFDNLFGDFFESRKQPSLKKIFETLGLSQSETEFGLLDIQAQKIKEEALVKKCIQLLRRNQFNEQQRNVWENFLRCLEDNEQPKALEELFKIANAIMIAMASSGKEKYETCSLLPLSEKQIQVEYAGYSKKMNRYPPVLNMTVLDPLLSYAPNRPKGLVFYFTTLNRGTLSELSTKNYHAKKGTIGRNSFLKEAQRNIARLAQGEATLPLQDVLATRQPKW